MFTTLSPTDIANLALAKIGAQSIQSLTDLTNPSAIVCNSNFQIAFESVARATRWNCLLTTAVLNEVPQIPLPSVAQRLHQYLGHLIHHTLPTFIYLMATPFTLLSTLTLRQVILLTILQQVLSSKRTTQTTMRSVGIQTDPAILVVGLTLSLFLVTSYYLIQ